MTIDRADTFDTLGWAGLCDLVHVALLQGDCSPPGADRDVTVTLSATSYAVIDSITGPLRCAGGTTGAAEGATRTDMGLTAHPSTSSTVSAIRHQLPYSTSADLGRVVSGRVLPIPRTPGGVSRARPLAAYYPRVTPRAAR